MHSVLHGRRDLMKLATVDPPLHDQKDHAKKRRTTPEHVVTVDTTHLLLLDTERERCVADTYLKHLYSIPIH
jgi:hypothetical protein